AIIIVLDGVGVGAAPDAAAYGDADVHADSLGHTAQAVGGLDLAHLARLGLGNVGHFEGLPPNLDAAGAYGRMAEASAGKDAVTRPEPYRICELARELLRGAHAVGRVIARPFTGASGHYTRANEARRDWALAPPAPHLLDLAAGAGLEVQGVGKIEDIFAGRSVTSASHALNNDAAIAVTVELLRRPTRGIVFSNLIEFDMVYGHRKDPHGYARALRRFDDALPSLQDAMGPSDVLFITGDHGVDPTGPGTDHTREYVPLLVAGRMVRAGTDLGTRATFADLGATVAELLGLPPLE